MDKFVCIHGHFYQPTRENPWLEEVEVQDSAYPYHDWNQKITAECYAPNAASRIIGPDRRIIDIINNYSMISFDFGPTLLSWMERHAQETYGAIIEADLISRKNFSGHGSALALAYNHIILPLASEKDKLTQVRWGIEDFKARFRREPEGMWIPETAVDTPTLEALAGEGIKFTILAPHQAARIRRIGEKEWVRVENGRLNTNYPYLCRLPSGNAISIFFYNEAISKEVAFGGLLNNGEEFAKRIMGGFLPEERRQLVSIATDGETYGHHHKFGEMALSYCLHYIRSNNLAKITNYGEFLEKSPPEYEVEIAERSSWSCAHGVERWRDDCGCNTGTCPLQGWRKPLRDAMDWLRDEAASAFEKGMRKYTDDPWVARDKYIRVVLDRSKENVEAFLESIASRKLALPEKREVLKLLEMSRNSMLMQTSCGWFFDDISGIESVQIIKHAARCIQLLEEITGRGLEGDYLKMLERAKSNFSKFGDGAKIYQIFVKPSKVDLIRAGMHYVVSSIFNGGDARIHRIYCYTINDMAYDMQRTGKNVLVTGNSRITSEITWDEEEICYAVLWLGDHNIYGGARRFLGDREFASIQGELLSAFAAGNLQRVISLIDIDFGKEGLSCSLTDLFKDRQIEVLGKILEVSMRRAISYYQQVFDDNLSAMAFMKALSLPIPLPLRAAAEVVLTHSIIDLLRSERFDVELFCRYVDDALRLQISLDREGISLEVRRRIEKEFQQLEKAPDDLEKLEDIELLLRATERLQLGVNVWLAQNILFRIISQWHQHMRKMESSGDEKAKRWLDKIRSLAELLGIRA